MTRAFAIEARDLTRQYRMGGGMLARPRIIDALRGVSFQVQAGRTLAVVGESGCGKSTLARLVTMIDTPTSGQLLIDGAPVDISRGVPRDLRRKVQIVFQNPYGSLNPRQKVVDVLAEPLSIHGRHSRAEQRRLALDMLGRVGLGAQHLDRYPHMFSGGQRQRIAIARALMLRPGILVLDEPVSALDLSVQAQVLNLLGDLQAELGLTYIFISHDLTVVRHIADDVMVMHRGRVVERGPAGQVLSDPQDAYTRALLAATPRADADAVRARLARRHAAA